MSRVNLVPWKSPTPFFRKALAIIPLPRAISVLFLIYSKTIEGSSCKHRYVNICQALNSLDEGLDKYSIPIKNICRGRWSELPKYTLQGKQ